MDIPSEYIWLIAGAILIILEITTIPGVGFLFAGLGALMLGIFMELGFVEKPLWQWIIFFGLTVIWAVVLWKPLKNFRQGNNPPFKDMEGQKAIVTGKLEPGKTGHAKWSGTKMKAKLDESAKKAKADGDEVEVVGLDGNILIVK